MDICEGYCKSMSEQPTTNKNLDEKLDTVIEKVTRMEETLKNMPKVEVEKDKNTAQKFDMHDKRISNLEGNQRWIIIVVLGTIANAIMQLVLHNG